jgi:hypothetical protein
MTKNLHKEKQELSDLAYSGAPDVQILGIQTTWFFTITDFCFRNQEYEPGIRFLEATRRR